MGPAMLLGTICCVLLALPTAALCTLVYRFPIPFFGYGSGPAAVPDALNGAVWYLRSGGVFVLMLLGAGAGAVAFAVGRPDRRRVRRLSVAFAALATALAVLCLATLDKIIGPW